VYETGLAERNMNFRQNFINGQSSVGSPKRLTQDYALFLAKETGLAERNMNQNFRQNQKNGQWGDGSLMMLTEY
jgi:uncharacterized protein YukJ